MTMRLSSEFAHACVDEIVELAALERVVLQLGAQSGIMSCLRHPCAPPAAFGSRSR